MTTILIVLAVAVAGVLIWVRVAPSDPGRWHRIGDFSADANLPGGVRRLVQAGPDGLARLDAVARATPRTERLAGSVEEGMITYITRSRVIGFPDYTTVSQEGETLRAHGRLRFGRSDFGVNRARVEGWLEALKP